MQIRSLALALRVGIVALSALLVLALPAFAAEVAPLTDATVISEDAPVDDYGDALYAFDSLTGQLALQSDVGYVYCPQAETPILAFQPDAMDQAKADLGATVNADGTWTLPDATVPVRPQTAGAVYALSGAPPVATTLPTVSQDRLVLVRAQWPNCRRFRRGYQCGGCYHCPQGCYPTRYPVGACSIRYSGTQNFKLCRYTGRPWDWCYEFTYYRCTAAGYPCNNCTGTPLWGVSWAGWSCWNTGC